MIEVYADGTLTYAGRSYVCALGRAGIIARAEKREGDGATPDGTYPIRSVWYRPDRIQLPKLNFPIHEITRTDGWCDDPLHPDYNRHVKLPFPASHENLWRPENEDHRYDILVVLGHNDDPVIPNRGSCIFWHVAEENYAPTAGCVAMSAQDLLVLLPQLSAQTKIYINVPFSL